MSHQSTEIPVPSAPTVTFGVLADQLPGLAVLARIGQQHPGLPVVMISQHGHTPCQIAVMLRSVDDVFAWQRAISPERPPQYVLYRGGDAIVRITADLGDGVCLDVWAPCTGELAEQRHQLDDPAVPPESAGRAVAGPVA